jgi:hypothetical protein
MLCRFSFSLDNEFTNAAKPLLQNALRIFSLFPSVIYSGLHPRARRTPLVPGRNTAGGILVPARNNSEARPSKIGRQALECHPGSIQPCSMMPKPEGVNTNKHLAQQLEAAHAQDASSTFIILHFWIMGPSKTTTVYK